MAKLARLNPEQRDNLAAYLDGELEETATQEIEQILAVSEVARHEVDMLSRTWDLLNSLPALRRRKNSPRRPSRPCGRAVGTRAGQPGRQAECGERVCWRYGWPSWRRAGMRAFRRPITGVLADQTTARRLRDYQQSRQVAGSQRIEFLRVLGTNARLGTMNTPRSSSLRRIRMGLAVLVAAVCGYSWRCPRRRAKCDLRQKQISKVGVGTGGYSAGEFASCPRMRGGLRLPTTS